MGFYGYMAGPVGLLILCASCHSVQQRPDAGDADALVSLYADDPIVMPQDHPPVIGKEAIRSLYRSVLDEYTIRGGGELLEVVVAGDWAFYRSVYTLTATPKAGGESLEDSGVSVVILRRQADGSWKIARLIANSDRPPSGGPADIRR